MRPHDRAKWLRVLEQLRRDRDAPDRQIAMAAGVSAPFVATVRRRQEDDVVRLRDRLVAQEGREWVEACEAAYRGEAEWPENVRGD